MNGLTTSLKIFSARQWHGGSTLAFATNKEAKAWAASKTIWLFL